MKKTLFLTIGPYLSLLLTFFFTNNAICQRIKGNAEDKKEVTRVISCDYCGKKFKQTKKKLFGVELWDPIWKHCDRDWYKNHSPFFDHPRFYCSRKCACEADEE